MRYQISNARPELKELAVSAVNYWDQNIEEVQFKDDKYNCLISLIKFLKSIGLNLVYDYGIRWMYEIVNHRKFSTLNENETYELAELLDMIWNNDIKNINRTFFMYLLNRCVENGNNTAITLQDKIKKIIN